MDSHTPRRKNLTAEQYRILHMRGSEPPFHNAFWANKIPGVYRCAGCGTEVFHSLTKYDSGTGWPTFYAPSEEENIAVNPRGTGNSDGTPVSCRSCGGHLGHLFEDGPAPTGRRYSINSASLEFEHRPDWG